RHRGQGHRGSRQPHRGGEACHPARRAPAGDMTPEQKTAALAAIQAQIAALDGILKNCSIELNFVRAKERMLKWQQAAVPVLAEHVGPVEAKRFGAVRPGPAFTNDLMEEVSDEAETYRNALEKLAKAIRAQ